MRWPFWGCNFPYAAITQRGNRNFLLLFGAAEETFKALQAKNTSVQKALTTAKFLMSFFKRQKTDSLFNPFFAGTEAHATELKIGSPAFPRYRRQPRWLNDGEEQHRFDTPKAMFRQVYFEACDLLIGELNDWFNQDFMAPLRDVEDVGEEEGEEDRAIQ